MNKHTTFISRDFMSSLLNEIIEDIEINFEKTNLILHQDLYPVDRDSYHFIGQALTRFSFSRRNQIAKAFCNTIFKDVYRSEVSSANSAKLAFLFGLEFSKLFIKHTEKILENKSENKISIQEKINNELNCWLATYKAVLREEAKIIDPEGLYSIIEKVCTSKTLSMVVWEAIQAAGIEGRIFVENGRQNNFIVELKEGYNFSLKPFKFLLENGTWDMRNTKVLIVDGLVEKISEIDQILIKSFETKQPLVVIAQGFSEEVVATFKTNQDRGLLNAQAIRIPTSIDSLNIINDIAIVCGCLPVSSMKGDLLTFVKYDDLPTIERIKIETNNTIIENSKTRAAVSSQIKAILQKRQEYFLHEEVQEIFDKRIKSLVSNSVVIHLPEASSIEQDNQRVQIDLSLRQIKSLINHGIINLSKVKNSLINNKDRNQSLLQTILNDSFEKAIDKLCENNEERIPTLSAYLGCSLMAKSMLMFLSSSGIVTSNS